MNAPRRADRDSSSKSSYKPVSKGGLKNSGSSKPTTDQFGSSLNRKDWKGSKGRTSWK